MPICSIVKCRSSNGSHKFPRNEEVFNQWVAAIRVGQFPFVPKSTTVICDNHFRPDDYELPFHSFYHDPNLRLKKNAVPSIFPWTGKNEFAGPVDKHWRKMYSYSDSRFEETLDVITNKIRMEMEANKKHKSPSRIQSSISRPLFRKYNACKVYARRKPTHDKSSQMEIAQASQDINLRLEAEPTLQPFATVYIKEENYTVEEENYTVEANYTVKEEDYIIKEENFTEESNVLLV